MSEHSLNLSSTRRTAKKPTVLPPLDWAAGHGPVTGALSAATGAGATALLGAAASMPSGWPLAIGAAGALGHGVGHSLYRRLTGRTLVTRAASWLLAGGWTTWAVATGPLSWTAAGSLAALGVGIGAAASNAAAHEEAAEEERLSAEAKAATAALDSKRRGLAREWEERIKRVCAVDVTVFAVEFWATGSGYSLAAELPGGGATWDRIATRARALAADARLPLGCTVHVEEGDLQGRVVLDVATENVMGSTYPYPADYGPLSILTGIPWGLLPVADPVTVYLREACALILGPPGSGKSTFLDAVLAGFARCTDVVTWVIDLKKGAVGIPWVRPWLEAEGHRDPKPGTARPPAGTRPGIDWLASTPAEALLMLTAALAINDARQLHYQDLMDQQDTTLLPVSARIPQIEIVVDEGAELLSGYTRGNRTLKEVQKLVRTVMRTTRAMGIRLVLTAVDGNVSAIGDTATRKFSPVGVALTSGESSGNNLGKLFPHAKVDTSQLNQQGAGVIGAATADGFAPTAFKGWKTSPSMVRDVVLATNDRRPVLDEISAQAAGTAYARRWDANRTAWLRQGPADEDTPAQETTTEPTTERPTLGLSYEQQEPAAPAAEPARRTEADMLSERLMREIDEQFGTTPEPDRTTEPKPPRPRADSLNLSCLRDEPPADEDDHPGGPGDGPDWLPQALDAIASAGPAGMKPSAVADLVQRDRKTVRAALRAAADRGQLIYRNNGPHSVYVHPDHT
ncbi:hypothetical protein [Streptomyces albus]|uniref:hypothetical protein n=1 Tax=Streptomyces albus TaxID=1888 RepID=UPI0006922541|nr:hypothetical protein [Streptomyces albus]